VARDGEEMAGAKLQAIKTELKRRRHEPVASVGAWLRKVTSGYYQYTRFPVTCLGSNFSAGGSAGSGGAHYRGAASAAESPWTGLNGSWTVLCGGRSVMIVPTATARPSAYGMPL
jgi:hypothetical protein